MKTWDLTAYQKTNIKPHARPSTLYMMHVKLHVHLHLCLVEVIRPQARGAAPSLSTPSTTLLRVHHEPRVKQV